MNTRIKKKKFNKWETDRVYNITVSFEDVPFVFIAWQSQRRIPDFQTFATSKNAMRAVKSYCKKNVWKTGKCDNIKDMYRVMCEEIHADREYHKRIKEYITAEDLRNADCPDIERATEMFIDLYNDINS